MYWINIIYIYMLWFCFCINVNYKSLLNFSHINTIWYICTRYPIFNFVLQITSTYIYIYIYIYSHGRNWKLKTAMNFCENWSQHSNSSPLNFQDNCLLKIHNMLLPIICQHNSQCIIKQEASWPDSSAINNYITEQSVRWYYGFSIASARRPWWR